LVPLKVVGAAIIERDRCLVTQRSSSMREPLCWEFPGGKLETGESPEEALVREIAEELGLVIKVGAHLGQGLGENSGQIVQLDVYLAQHDGGELHLVEHADAAWIRADQIYALDWAAADLPILPALESTLRDTR
jgi:8-oxo-dGTP diphosphatase